MPTARVRQLEQQWQDALAHSAQLLGRLTRTQAAWGAARQAHGSPAAAPQALLAAILAAQGPTARP